MFSKGCRLYENQQVLPKRTGSKVNLSQQTIDHYEKGVLTPVSRQLIN